MDAPRSEAAREASRKNGRRSMGPVTRLGRQISSRNAFKHGLRARQTIDPKFLPAWVQDVERRICLCFRYISPRRREYLDRVSSALLRTQQADQLIAAELGLIMASVTARGSEGLDNPCPDLAQLEQLLIYRRRFSATRDRWLGSIVADKDLMPFHRSKFGKKGKPLRRRSQVALADSKETA